jgi:hypothetical protein
VSGEGGGGEAQKEFTTVAAAVNAIKKKKMVLFSLFMFLFSKAHSSLHRFVTVNVMFSGSAKTLALSTSIDPYHCLPNNPPRRSSHSTSTHL